MTLKDINNDMITEFKRIIEKIERGLYPMLLIQKNYGEFIII